MLLSRPGAIANAPNFQGPLWFLESAFQLAHQDLTPHLVPAEEALKQHFAGCRSTASPDQTALDRWSASYRILQAAEVWQTFGRWIHQSAPQFAPEIEQRFVFASTVSGSQVNEALLVRAQAVAEIERLLEDDAVLCLPTTWNIAPLLSSTAEARDDNRSRNFKLTCISTLSGTPQLTVPIPGPEGLRIGLSFIAAKGKDVQLLKLAHETRQVLSQLERPDVAKLG